VQLPPEGTEVLVSLEEADRGIEWFRELQTLLAPMRAELTVESEEAVDVGIARAVEMTPTTKRGGT
jgi:hypothetical protein